MSLRRIVLRDFVIVPSLELDLQTGFTVLTGETGAGKSILIDALQLVLGGRADSAVVREGATRCEVAAEFDPPTTLTAWLQEQGFAQDEGLLLRRSVDSEGRSRAWINGSPATATQLRTLGAGLVDIHGQHAWQGLTRPEAVRELLDGFAGLDTGPVREAWRLWRQRRQALDKALADQDAWQDTRDRLSWQLAELDKLSPRAGEWEDLNQRHRQLANAQTLIDAAHEALQALDDADTHALGLMHQAQAALQAQASIEPRFGPPIENLENALAQVQDAVHGLRQMLRHTELDPDQLQTLDQRLSQWLSLARRHRRAPEDLHVLHGQWRAELEALTDSHDLEALQQAEQSARQALDQAATALARRRRQAAPRMAKAVTEVMQTLGMAGGRFDVALDTLPEPQAHGSDAVEFRVAGHAGASPRAIGKVASGGELSRIALALSVITSRLGQTPTLIFDEVDAGVGGAVAHTVGRLLRQLGEDRQVLAVTHLAQVAARAHQHLRVHKRPMRGQTISEVGRIEGEPRVDELARMLGGDPSSQVSRAHALELLQS